jgi:hypothetical protein
MSMLDILRLVVQLELEAAAVRFSLCMNRGEILLTLGRDSAVSSFRP